MRYDSSSFVGRVEELAELSRRVEAGARLITITGPPGVGKSRLLREYLRDRTEDYQITFCSEDPDPAILRGDLTWEPEDAPGLLAIDDADPLVGELGRWLPELLRDHPDLVVLVTSRRSLGIGEESRLSLGGLDGEQGIALYAEAAGRVCGELTVTEELREQLQGLVTLLDGHPLALELAAGRFAAIPPGEFLKQPVQALGLLKTKAASPERHLSLMDAVGWSFEQIDDEAVRSVFARCSVFRGGFGPRAVEAVFPEESLTILEILDDLVHRSLLTRELLADGEMRFLMSTTVGYYARRRLLETDEAGQTRKAHALHFAEQCRQRRRADTHAEIQAWLTWLERERANLAEAMEVCLDEELFTEAADLARALAEVAELSAPVPELKGWLDRLAMSDALDPVRHASVLLERGEWHHRTGSAQDGLADWEDALEILGDEESGALRCWLHLRCSDRMQVLGDLDGAREHMDLALPEARSDARLYRLALVHDASVHLASGDRGAARERLTALAPLPHHPEVIKEFHFLRLAVYVRFHLGQDAGLDLQTRRLLRIAEEVGLDRLMASCRRLIGDDAYSRRELETAMESYEEAAEIYRGFGDRYYMAVVLASLGGVYLLVGDTQAAQACFKEALITQRALGVKTQVSQLLLATAAIYHERGDYVSAEQNYAEVCAMADDGMMPARMGQMAWILRGWCATEQGLTEAREYLETGMGWDTPGDDSPMDVTAELSLALAAGATDEFEAAAARWPEATAGTFSVYFDVLGHLMNLADGPEAEEIEAAREYGEGIASPALRSSFTVRVLLAWLRRRVERAEAAEGAAEPASTRPKLTVGIRGTWFRWDDEEPMDLTRRRGLRQILETLARRHVEARGEVVSLREVFDVGWPGQRIHASSEKTRVYWAISTLRKLGLDDAIQTAGEGYMLDPGIDVELVEPET